MPSAIKVDISQPCNQNWENMQSSDSGRYCGSCQKTVIDFSVMSDKEIFQYINEATASVCGRFSSDQLNKTIPPLNREKPGSYWKSVWQLLIAGTLFTSQAKSQVKSIEPTSISPLANNTDSLNALLKSLDENAFLVIDGANKQPLSGATVIVDDANNITDNKGIFTINNADKKITVSYIGYKTREFSLKTGPIPKWIELERNADLLNEVSITAASVTCKRSYTTGGISSVRILQPFQKFVRNVNQLIPDPAVKIFPNPVIKGQPVNIQLALSKPGRYSLKIFTTDGKLVYVQPLQITSAKQQLQLPTSSLHSSAVYWLQIESISEKQQAHEVKLVIR